MLEEISAAFFLIIVKPKHAQGLFSLAVEFPWTELLLCC